MIADALHNGRSAGVAHAEALARHAVDERLAAGSAVQRHVADDDIVLMDKLAGLGRIHDDLPAGEALAEIVVGVTLQFQRQPLGDEGAEGLAAAAVALDRVGVITQAVAVEPGDLTAEDGAEGAVGGGHLQLDVHGLALLEGLAHLLQQDGLVHRVLQLEVIDLFGNEVGILAALLPGVVQHAAQIHHGRPLGHHVLAHLQQVAAAGQAQPACVRPAWP